MLTLATDATADQLLDYLASDGAGAKWTCYAASPRLTTICGDRIVPTGDS